MARKGQRRYVCLDCKAESWHHWVELNRAGRMRCSNCGSSQLELRSKKAKENHLIAMSVRSIGGPLSFEERKSLNVPTHEPDLEYITLYDVAQLLSRLLNQPIDEHLIARLLAEVNGGTAPEKVSKNGITYLLNRLGGTLRR